MSRRTSSFNRRVAYLTYRCYHGYDKGDNDNNWRIDEKTSLVEWNELLHTRFALPRGGAAFVAEIMNIVKEKKTAKGQDLSDRKETLELLYTWSRQKSAELSADFSSNKRRRLRSNCLDPQNKFAASGELCTECGRHLNLLGHFSCGIRARIRSDVGLGFSN